jgi:hypothetical protein
MGEVITSGGLAGRRTHLLSLLSKKPTQGMLPGDIEDCASIIEDWQRSLVEQFADPQSPDELGNAITLLRECERICEATLYELDETEALHLGAHRLAGLAAPSPRLYAAEAARQARERVAASQEAIGLSLRACARKRTRTPLPSQRIQVPRRRLELTRIPAAELLGQALQEACVRCERAGVYFAAFLDSDLHLRVDLDVVHPALVRVLHDAIVESTHGGTVRAYARLGGNSVSLEVVSDGRGSGRVHAVRELEKARTAIASHDGRLTVSEGPDEQRIYRIELPAFFD